MSVYIKDSQQAAKACVIWLHGLGANAEDMMGVADELPLNVPIRHVFMDAPVRPVTLNNHMPMRAWYDILGLSLADREDIEGIKQSETLIHQVIKEQMTQGFKSEQIFLAGFSQGGAMALFTALQSPFTLAGVVALSAYLPLASVCQIKLPIQTPVFMGAGRYDQVVKYDWTRAGVNFLQSRGFQQIAWHEYPIEHTICLEEIRDLAQWLTRQIEAMYPGE